MKRAMWDIIKVFIVFTLCTFIFYFGLRLIHNEYEEYHRYDIPEGPAAKVFKSEDGILDRLHLFFRLGE